MNTKLYGVHPELVTKVTRMLYACAELGFPMVVTDGVRTDDEQRALYAKGRTAAGSIVTHADGVTNRSNHQVKADGYGYAVDCAFLVDGKPSWEPSHPWPLYGAMARAMGLKWGGDFTTIVDRPHVEMTEHR